MGNVGYACRQFGTVSVLNFFFCLLGHRAVCLGIASFGFDFKDIAADFFVNGFGNFFRIAAVGIIGNQDFRSGGRRLFVFFAQLGKGLVTAECQYGKNDGSE